LVIDPDRCTAGYLAVLDPNGSLVIGVADMGIYDTVNAEWVETAVARAAGADLWVVDANLPGPILEALAPLAPVPVLADPVSVAKAIRLRPILPRLHGVFPDAPEAAVLADGDPGDPFANATAIAVAGVEHVVVSLGDGGAHIHTSEVAETRPAATPDRVVDVTGAGDALLAGYAYALVSDEADPLGWGLAAASLAVETDTSVAGHLSRETVHARLR
jgi:pseudouridine kinase